MTLSKYPTMFQSGSERMHGAGISTSGSIISSPSLKLSIYHQSIYDSDSFLIDIVLYFIGYWGLCDNHYQDAQRNASISSIVPTGQPRAPKRKRVPAVGAEGEGDNNNKNNNNNSDDINKNNTRNGKTKSTPKKTRSSPIIVGSSSTTPKIETNSIPISIPTPYHNQTQPIQFYSYAQVMVGSNNKSNNNNNNINNYNYNNIYNTNIQNDINTLASFTSSIGRTTQPTTTTPTTTTTTTPTNSNDSTTSTNPHPNSLFALACVSAELNGVQEQVVPFTVGMSNIDSNPHHPNNAMADRRRRSITGELTPASIAGNIPPQYPSYKLSDS